MGSENADIVTDRGSDGRMWMYAATVRAAVIDVVTTIFIIGAGNVATVGAAAEVPTFTNEVAPILYENCVVCHREGENAPMSLVTYEEARPWSRSIKSKVLAGEMPPWHAEPAVGRFSNERGLSDVERDTLVRWVNAGAPQGDPSSLPPAPQFAEGWQIGTPDVVVEMPKAFVVPAEGEVPYQYFIAPTNLPLYTTFSSTRGCQRLPAVRRDSRSFRSVSGPRRSLVLVRRGLARVAARCVRSASVLEP